MRCPDCGAEVAEDQAFCMDCGRALKNEAASETGAPSAQMRVVTRTEPPASPMTPSSPPPPAFAPPPAPPPPPPTFAPPPAPLAGLAAPATPQPSAAVTKPPKKKRGCLKGCLVIVVIFLLLIALAAVVVFRVPERLGLFPSKAETLLAGTTDIAAAARIEEDMASVGQDTAGIQMYVLPVGDTEDTVAYIVLDQSQGYVHSSVEADDPVKDAFIIAARSEAVRTAGVTRVAVEFKDDTGKSLFVMTAPVGAILDLADGRITEDEFFKRTAAVGDLYEAVQTQMEWLGELQ